MNRRSIIGLAAAGVVATALLGWALIPAAIAVETAPVRLESFVQTVDEQARTRIRDHYVIAAPLSGEIDRIALREGDDVAAGAVIARLHPALPALLDSRTELELRRRAEAARAAKESAEARVARTQAALVQARLEAERSRKLAADQLVPAAKLQSDELLLVQVTHELESARADAHVAQHEIDIAVAAQARVRAGSSGGASAWPLTAPIAGRVLRIQQKSAGAVGVGTALLELGDPGNIEVLIELLTTEAPLVTAGSAVTLANWGGHSDLAGRVRRVEPLGFTKISALGVEEQRVNVLVDIISPRANWQALGEGYRLDARIEVYRNNQALTVPTGALIRAGEHWIVYSVAGGRRAHQVRVEIGHRNDRDAEILGGLKQGERVVVYPNDALRDGVRVAAVAAPSQS
jgi:HlyD family secretion protein